MNLAFVLLGALAAVAGIGLLVAGMMLAAFGILIAGFAIAYSRAEPLETAQ